MYFAYILKSQSSGIHYYGSTKDLSARLIQHNRGKVRFTKGHLPWKLIYHESYPTRSLAVQRELFFKSVDGYYWLKENKIL